MKLMELDIQRFAFFLYDIVYCANDGTSTTNMQNYSSESDPLWTNEYTRTGYTFSGWNTAADGTGTDIPITATAGDVYAIVGGGVAYLYAQWTATEDKYITLENLTRYDGKIKEYISEQGGGSLPAYALASEYATLTDSTNNIYTLDYAKIISTGFSGRLYNDIIRTSGHKLTTDNTAYHSLTQEIIDIFIVSSSNNQFDLCVYDGIYQLHTLGVNSDGTIANGTAWSISGGYSRRSPEPY